MSAPPPAAAPTSRRNCFGTGTPARAGGNRQQAGGRGGADPTIAESASRRSSPACAVSPGIMPLAGAARSNIARKSLWRRPCRQLLHRDAGSQDSLSAPAAGLAPRDAFQTVMKTSRFGSDRLFQQDRSSGRRHEPSEGMMGGAPALARCRPPFRVQGRAGVRMPSAKWQRNHQIPPARSRECGAARFRHWSARGSRIAPRRKPIPAAARRVRRPLRCPISPKSPPVHCRKGAAEIRLFSRTWSDLLTVRTPTLATKKP